MILFENIISKRLNIDTPEVEEAGYQEAKDYLDALNYNKENYLDIDDIYTYDPLWASHSGDVCEI